MPISSMHIVGTLEHKIKGIHEKFTEFTTLIQEINTHAKANFVRYNKVVLVPRVKSLCNPVAIDGFLSTERLNGIYLALSYYFPILQAHLFDSCNLIIRRVRVKYVL